MPEGVEMHRISLYKKETDTLVKLLQNRLDLLRRQEREIKRTTSCQFKNEQKKQQVKENERRDQQMILEKQREFSEEFEIKKRMISKEKT